MAVLPWDVPADPRPTANGPAPPRVNRKFGTPVPFPPWGSPSAPPCFAILHADHCSSLSWYSSSSRGLSDPATAKRPAPTSGSRSRPPAQRFQLLIGRNLLPSACSGTTGAPLAAPPRPLPPHKSLSLSSEIAPLLGPANWACLRRETPAPEVTAGPRLAARP